MQKTDHFTIDKSKIKWSGDSGGSRTRDFLDENQTS